MMELGRMYSIRECVSLEGLSSIRHSGVLEQLTGNVLLRKKLIRAISCICLQPWMVL